MRAMGVPSFVRSRESAGNTVTSTVSATLASAPRETTSENVKVVVLYTLGVTKLGRTGVVRSSVTEGPAVCVHAKVNATPGAPDDSPPSSVAGAPEGEI